MGKYLDIPCLQKACSFDEWAEKHLDQYIKEHAENLDNAVDDCVDAINKAEEHNPGLKQEILDLLNA